MKTTSSYFPFFIISLVLYGFVFIYIEKPKRITTLPINSGEQSIQVRFISQPGKLKTPTEDKPAQPTRQETVVTPRPKIAKVAEVAEAVEIVEVQPKKVIKSVKISESDLKLRKQALLESIAKADTDSAAHLKAAVFHQQLNKIKKRPFPPPLPSTSSSATKKLIVKKSPSENSSLSSSSTTNQGVLQEAIVVSGSKPLYPQRAILRNQQGRVVVKLTITEKGLPKNPRILTSSGFSLLDDAVLAFINQELFMPALQGEDKVISEQLFAFRFELN